MGLSEALDAFDGKLTEPLISAVADFDDEDAELLVELCHGKQATGATWIVKRLLEVDRASELDLARYFAALQNQPAWLAELHLLQSVQFAPDAAAPEVFAVRGRLDHPKTFVRVWALDAFVRIALVERAFLEEAHLLVGRAATDERASMRSRAKALGRLLRGIVK